MGASKRQDSTLAVIHRQKTSLGYLPCEQPRGHNTTLDEIEGGVQPRAAGAHKSYQPHAVGAHKAYQPITHVKAWEIEYQTDSGNHRFEYTCIVPS